MSEITETLPPQTAAPRPPAAPPAAPASQYLSILDSRRKSPGLACFLSLMPGLGQVYVGYYQRGFVHAAVVATLITVLSSEIRELTPMVAIFLTFFWLYNIIDAGRRAALYNEVLAGRTGIELPADLMLPGLGGSMLGGTGGRPGGRPPPRPHRLRHVALLAEGVVAGRRHPLRRLPLHQGEDGSAGERRTRRRRRNSPDRVPSAFAGPLHAGRPDAQSGFVAASFRRASIFLACASK